MTTTGHKRLALLTALASSLALLGAADVASAVTRYAAPGGTATDAQCTSPTGPYCGIGTAAGGTNVVAADEAVILPGHYSDTAGDLNGDTGNPNDGTVQPTAGSVHGVAGQPRPVITVDGPDTGLNPYGAFLLDATTLSGVEIVGGDAASSALTIIGAGAIVDRVVAGARRDNAITCNHWNGVLRDSACLGSGSGGIAVGASLFSGQTVTSRLRNVTAVSTGTSSFGLNYFFATASPPQGPNYTISAKSVIAQGTSQDAFARANTAPSTVTINLDHSNYDSVSTATTGGGVATVTPAGTGAPNFNVTDAPLLAADGYHQLAGSPTINAGATDGNSGVSDIDGQSRQIGIAPPDIGADEAGIGSATSVTCTPSQVVAGTAATCTATVTVPAEFLSGSVSFSSAPGGGSFAGGGTCPVSSAALSDSCQVTFTPAAAGTHQIIAVYSGDSTHEGSSASTPLAATPPPSATSPNKKKCKKGFVKKKIKGKRKCVRKKKKG